MSPMVRSALISCLCIVTVGGTSAVLGLTGGETTGTEALIILAVFVVGMTVFGINFWRSVTRANREDDAL